MIAALCSALWSALLSPAALAAPPAVDVLLKPIIAQTRPVTAHQERLNIYGQDIGGSIPPDVGGLGHRGLAVELSNPALSNPWVLSAGWSHARSRFDFRGLTFAPTTMDMHLTAGLMPWFHQDDVPTFDGYLSMLAGIHASSLAARPVAPTTVAFAPQLSLGMGIATRRLPVRLRAETRLDLVPHFEPGDGRVELPQNALAWRWYPASAALSILIGAGFGGRGE